MSAHHRSLAARRRAAPGQGDAPTGGRRPAAGGGFLTAGLLAALAISPGLNAQTPPAAPAQTPPATTSSLLEQGRYWQARNNDARAAEAWGRLLQAEPTNAEALYNLGLLELKANRPARAREYLAQLRASGTADLDAARLEQEINLRAGDNPKALEQARLLASSGELDKAVAQYRTVFGGKTPQGRIALEYYGYLGYTNDGWDEARQGLERLQRESPDNVQVSLTLAKLLTRKESTRAEGIRRLARLSSRQDVGGDADESWRAALTWYGDPRPADAPLFEAYLKAHPNDTEIRQQYSRTRKAGSSTAARSVAPSPQDAQLSRAFKELEGGNLDSAEADLTALLQANPNHADALGGMGVLRLKQERPDEAVEFLTRATRQPRARAVAGNRCWASPATGRSTPAPNAHARPANWRRRSSSWSKPSSCRRTTGRPRWRWEACWPNAANTRKPRKSSAACWRATRTTLPRCKAWSTYWRRPTAWKKRCGWFRN